MENKCKNLSEVAVPWAGKLLKYCKEHANRIVILGNAMGSPVEPRLLPPNVDRCESIDDLEAK